MAPSENMQDALAMAKALLYRRNIIDRAGFDDVIKKVSAVNNLSDDEVRQIEQLLESTFNILIPDSTSLVDMSDHEEWVPEKGQRPFWDRYYKYLEMEGDLPRRALWKLDELTDQALGYLENPHRKGRWSRRGMVVGQVQSGKTSNYTGLICKATDAGYKVIIVLAGLHSSLRSQTQLRLDEGFLGRDTNQSRVYQTNSPIIGVGKLPGPEPTLIPITTSHPFGDFRKTTSESHTPPPGDVPILIVAKKNPAVLEYLLKWVRANLAHELRDGERFVSGAKPLLLIDDEADNASVNTSKLLRDDSGAFIPDQKVTRINGQIRRLLRTFDRSAYVGYTATPFANIYIPPYETKNEGKDLFPEGFIVNLHPPSNYIGPVQMFGLNSVSSDGVEGLPIIRTVNDADVFAPARHKADHVELMDELPGSLVEAIQSFILVCAARRARGQDTEHNSMLVHVSRFVNAPDKDPEKLGVQGRARELIALKLHEFQNELRNGDGAHSPSLLDDLRGLWESNFVETTRQVREILNEDTGITNLSWLDIEPHLTSASDKIKVKEINGKATDALEYYENRIHGLSVIAVGGDKLSRGLTLYGLSVSYYLRATNMYDTLMQMGRWFGYRPGYADLCRLYITSELKTWYELVTAASEELRREFDVMALYGMTPKDFGLKVRMHPGILLITSAGKARYGQKVRISVMGQLVESYRLGKDRETIRHNISVTEHLLAASGEPENRNGTPLILWRGHDNHENVAEFINEFLVAPPSHSSPPSPASEPARLAEFIRKKATQGELKDWTIALCTVSSGPPSSICGIPVKLPKRTPDWDKSTDAVYEIRKAHILDKKHEWADLDADELSRAIEARRMSEDNPEKVIDEPNGASARQVRPRSRGLLILYPLDPTVETVEKNGLRLFEPDDERCNVECPIIGFAISFPGFGSKSDYEDGVEYLANTVYMEQEMDRVLEDEEYDENDE